MPAKENPAGEGGARVDNQIPEATSHKPSQPTAQAARHLCVADIFIPPGRRPIDQCKMTALAESLERLGLLQAIIVREEGGRIRLVAGAHRLAAAKSLGWTHIAVTFVTGDDVRIRLAEISENLHRSELSALERDELIAEWIRLIETPGVSRQVDAKPQGGRPEGGVRAAARELQISEPDARRAIKVASISNEAKAAAREVGLNINRTALLEAAKQAEPKKQVETIRSRAKKPKSLLDRINPLDLAWDRSIKAQRREFVRKRWIELMRVHEEDHPAVAAYTELRRIKQAADRAEVRAAAHGDGLDIPAELRRPAS
jgi:ParB-like chromosome segregation protein Spo0J